jgi:hypothetical protein
VSKTRALLVLLVVFVLGASGVFAYRYQQNRSNSCVFETKRWREAGLPPVGSSDEFFVQALSTEEVKAQSTIWAGQLLCSNNYREAARLFNHYLNGSNRNVPYLMLVSREFVRQENQNGRKTQGKHFRMLFTAPALQGSFSAEEVGRLASRLGEGKQTFNRALYDLVAPRLVNDQERFILRAG